MLSMLLFSGVRHRNELVRIAFSFIKLISSSDTLTRREAVILKICPPAIVTSAEVIVAEYDAILWLMRARGFL